MVQHSTLSEGEVVQRIQSLIAPEDFQDQSLLLLIPDTTRTAPMKLLFHALYEHLSPVTSTLDVMVALGTHPVMSEQAICELLGISPADRLGKFASLQLMNHEWNRPQALMKLGELKCSIVEELSDGLLSEDVPVSINAQIANYDSILIVGPVFPHEVVGFSGGNKYFFPGISGPELLNFFHWLGALITNVGIIGTKQTPVRKVVDLAASLIPNQKHALCFVVDAKANIHDLFYGTPEESWNLAADLSSRLHIKRVPQPFHTVLSCAPTMYDELWVAGKCMYKLEPVVADGGELIIFAPHLKEISAMHGHLIEQIGYHVRDYFVKQWDKFQTFPRGVLAHSTHVRGSGTFENGIEMPRITVTLASGISEELCQKINLGYRDPESIRMEDYADKEDQGILLVPKAGEHLYRLENELS